MRISRIVFATVVVAGGAGCESAADSLFCESAGCQWPAREWAAVSALAAPADWKPPEDRSNKYVGNELAQKLGHKFFFDKSWSGPSNQVDVLRRPVGYARADAGKPTNLSCVSCHNLSRAGIDTESLPGNVSIGAAWADTNALPVVNAAFYGIQYWNGRADSLWAQAINCNEGTNMNGNRLSTAWLIYDKYKAEYDAVFAQYPLPFSGTLADVAAMVETEGARKGQCKLNPGCPTDGLPRGAQRRERRHRLLPSLPAVGQAGQQDRLPAGRHHRTVRRRLGLHGGRGQGPGHLGAGELRQGGGRVRVPLDQQGVGLRPVGAQRARRQPPAAEVHRCGRARRQAVRRQGGLRGLPPVRRCSRTASSTTWACPRSARACPPRPIARRAASATA